MLFQSRNRFLKMMKALLRIQTLSTVRVRIPLRGQQTALRERLLIMDLTQPTRTQMTRRARPKVEKVKHLPLTVQLLKALD